MATRYPLPKEATIHNRLLKFFSTQEFKRRNFGSIPSGSIRSIFRMWALCFRDVSCTTDDRIRISVERFLSAADFSVIQERNVFFRRFACDDQNLAIINWEKEAWRWMIAVSRRILIKQYKEFFADMLEKLGSPEFCVNLPTWNPEWISQVE